ncbi:MAG: AAA family ATPase [Gammaproteobacteria bacterium]|nr:AAA family ATPase [Gammaproteobacteria bacterium]MCP5425514.1 AAA family ATPase [Gammaproteobacteria bacterium]MCP5459366.1 AAA family ATPase [Gammaproteobacteria bacterium]
MQRQIQLLRALGDPERYPHPVSAVEHRETHISHILLAGDYAYKIKKPLDLGFLDFTSLARRKLFCEEELRLNRRLAPKLYLDCIAICGTVENPLLGGDPDQALEYAVKMRRFPQAALLDHCWASGVLQTRHMDNLARQLAGFHERIARAGADQPWGAPDIVQRPVMDNFTQTRPLLKDGEDLRMLDELQDWTLAAYARLRPALAERKAGGFIRECHGDLHLGNMLMLEEGQITVFDCIEFNDEFRWIDVMSDLGFLLMDLHKREAHALAWRLLNTYLEDSGDYAGLAVLPYYQVYRALVRAKIAAIRASQDDLDDGQRDVVRAECRAYLRLAGTFTQRPAPFLAITHGVSGSGKSHITAHVLETLGAIRIRSDVERKRLHGLAALASSGSAINQGLYTAASSARTYQRLAELAQSILAAGYATLVDAAFLQAGQRQPFRLLAERRGLPFIVLACSADPATLKARIVHRREQGDDAAEADLDVLEQQLRSYASPASEEDPIWVTPETVARVLTEIAARVQRVGNEPTEPPRQDNGREEIHGQKTDRVARRRLE